MTNQEILDNAPEGATHISELGSYVKTDSVGRPLTWSGYSWNPARPNIQSSLADIAELVELRKKNAELEKKLNPELFWDASNTEVSHDSIEELMHLKFEDGAQVGDEVEIQRAALLPNEMYIFTEINDEDYSCEYVLKGGNL